MPNIPVYDTPQQYWKLDVPEGGAQVLAQAAHRVGIAGQEAENARSRGAKETAAGIEAIGGSISKMGAKADAEQTQSEVSKGGLLVAQDQASRLDDLNKIAMTTDPSQIEGRIDQYVGENMGDAKAAFMANFTTPKAKAHGEDLWTRHEANIYNHATAVSEQASLDANHNNLTGAVNQLAATAGAHPSTLEENLGLIDHTIDTSLPGLPERQREAFSTTFRQEAKAKALAAGIKTMALGSPDGSIPPNPEGAKTLLDSGKYDDIIGKNMAGLHTLLEGATHQAGIDQATGAVAQHEAAVKQSDAVTQQYFSQIPQAGGPGVPNFGLRVMHDDSVTSEDKAALISVSTKLASGPAPTTNAMTLDHMVGRLASGDKPNNAQLLNQVSAGNLGLADAQFLMGQDPHSPALHQLQATLSDGKAALSSNSGSGIVTPAAQQAYTRFQQFALGAYKSGNPIDAKALPDVVARFRPTGQDAVAAIPQNARPSRPFAPGSLSVPPSDQQLVHIAATESSDRNITNPSPTSSGHAEGYFQITTGTWKDFAGKAGVDLAKYPSAISAPREVQAQVAKTIPLSRWDPKTLQYLRNKGVLR